MHIVVTTRTTKIEEVSSVHLQKILQAYDKQPLVLPVRKILNRILNLKKLNPLSKQTLFLKSPEIV